MKHSEFHYYQAQETINERKDVKFAFAVLMTSVVIGLALWACSLIP